MYFKGLDDAAFFAANSLVTDVFVVTAQFEVELLSMIDCEDIKAIGIVEKRADRKIWSTAELFDDQGRLAARGRGLFIASKIKLEPDVGYVD